MELAESTVKIKTSTKERITFGNNKNTFYAELKKQVKQHFEQTGIKSTGNNSLYVKAIFFTVTYFAGYFVLLTTPPTWIALGICAYMGAAAAALGFNIMHDGSHGSFSSKKWLNQISAYYINLLGGDAMLWKNKHNIIHHTFTNLEGFDQDIAQMPVLRLNSYQKKHWFHKYQHIYCFPLYGVSSVLWMFVLDFQKYFSGKVGNIRIPKITVKEHLAFWATKILYVTLHIAIPSLVWGWTNAFIGFMVYHFFLGLIISTVFQLAHVVENAEFPDSHFDSNKISDEWAIHQMKTTSNFATKNKFISWYVGGLNFQVEHHLFPKISHVHYPEINKIVKKVAMDFNVPYNEYPTIYTALLSHVNHLKNTAKA